MKKKKPLNDPVKDRAQENAPSLSREKEVSGERVCFHVLLINGFLTLIKFVAGIVGSSSVLVADAIHSLSDVLTTGGVLVALKLSKKPADWNHPYGHGKIESVAAKIVSIVLIGAGVGMLVSAYNQISKGVIIIPHEIAVWAALASIIIKELSYHYVMFTAKRIKSTVLSADAWHHRLDALSSVVALAGILGARAGYPILDPLLAALVSFFVIGVGFKLLRGAVDELIDALPDQELCDEICACGESVPGVKQVREVKVRKYGSSIIIDLVIVVDGQMTVEEGHGLAISAKEAIMEQIEHVDEVFIHVSPNLSAPTWEGITTVRDKSQQKKIEE